MVTIKSLSGLWPLKTQCRTLSCFVYTFGAASSKPGGTSLPRSTVMSTVSGTPADGRFGPDLTHLMSRATIAAGAAENTPANLRLWLQDPDAIKPGSLMPAMKLSDADLDAVVKYMETLR